MRFPYASYEVNSSSAVPRGVLYRPEVTIDVIGPQGKVSLQALVDTGSDQTVFPLSVAKTIGAAIDRESPERASAVGGQVVELIPGSVVLEISQENEKYRWETVVEFLDATPDDEIALLGYAGFLKFFRATFDSERKELELTPNGNFPTVQ